MRRFAVLLHEGHGPTHYDLMLEVAGEDRLATWRLGDWPPREGTGAEALPPHRRAYLNYEGPVGGGRGTVRRVAAGTWAGDVPVAVRFGGVPGVWRIAGGRVSGATPRP